MSKARQTSLFAYNDLKIAGEDKTQRDTIMNLMDCGKEFTRNEIQRYTHLSINAVCGRVDELVQLGKLRVVGTRKDMVSGRNNEVVQIVE